MKSKILGVLISVLLWALLPEVMAQHQIRSPYYFSNSTQVRSFVCLGKIIMLSNENDREVKIVSSSKEMKKDWEQTLDGSLVFSGNLSDKILVVVSTDFTAMFGGNNSTYKAIILNPLDGNMIVEKVIYNGNNDYLTVPEFVISDNGKTFSLFARETSIKRNFKLAQVANDAPWLTGMIDLNVSKIRSFSVSTFNTELVTIDKVVPTMPPGIFIGAVKAINNDLYIAVSERDKGVIIAKYEAGKNNATSIMIEPYAPEFKQIAEPKRYQGYNLMVDTHRNNTVYLTGVFKSEAESFFIFNKYDFGNNNQIHFRKSWKKADFKALERSFMPVNKELSELELGNISGMRILGVAFSKDNYLVALGDVHGLPASQGGVLPATYTANGILVYRLDSDLVEKSVAAIPRSYSNEHLPSFKSYLNNNSWYLFASDKWKARFTVAKVDVSSGKTEDLRIIEPEKAGKGQVAGLSEMAITDDYLVLPVKDAKISFGNKQMYDIHTYSIGWK